MGKGKMTDMNKVIPKLFPEIALVETFLERITDYHDNYINSGIKFVQVDDPNGAIVGLCGLNCGGYEIN